jgi:hypothetical protein
MRSPAARLILGAVALLALGTAAFFVNQIERQVTAARVAERAFDLSARGLANDLADLRIFQSAYMATGQDAEHWKGKVAESIPDVSKAIVELESDARGEATRAALAKARSEIVEFGNVDQRARDYLKSGQPLMAGDVIFSEGDSAANDASRDVNAARTSERQAAEAIEADLRKRQAVALAGAAGVVVVALLLLVLVSPRAAAETETETESLSIAHAASAAAPKSVPDADAPARAPESRYVTARPAGPVLRAASQLCTDLGRVSDLDELTSLIGQAADVMDASGIVIWVASADGTYVQLALSHGYAPQVTARMSRIMRSADNAAAAAYRTGQMQIVPARPGESNGAVVAPLLSADGCIGALSAETAGRRVIRRVQALAAIGFNSRASRIRRPPRSSREPRPQERFKAVSMVCRANLQVCHGFLSSRVRAGLKACTTSEERRNDLVWMGSRTNREPCGGMRRCQRLRNSASR